MLVCEVWVFIIGNIIAGTAHSLNQLVAGRLIAGVGGAGLLSLVTIIVSRTYESHLQLKTSADAQIRANARKATKYLSQPHQRSFYHCGLARACDWRRTGKVGQLEMDVGQVFLRKRTRLTPFSISFLLNAPIGPLSKDSSIVIYTTN